MRQDQNGPLVAVWRVARDPRLGKPGILRTIGDPPPRPVRHAERPHPSQSHNFTRQPSAFMARCGHPSRMLRGPVDSPALCIPEGFDASQPPPEHVQARRLSGALSALLRAGRHEPALTRRVCSHRQNPPGRPARRFAVRARHVPPSGQRSFHGADQGVGPVIRGRRRVSRAALPEVGDTAPDTCSRTSRPEAVGHSSIAVHPSPRVRDRPHRAKRTPAHSACPRAPDRLPVRLKGGIMPPTLGQGSRDRHHTAWTHNHTRTTNPRRLNRAFLLRGLFVGRRA
jgi:hypothetical protein